MTIFLEKHFKKLIIFLSGLLIFYLSFKPVTNPDTFMGIKIGELIVQNKQIPIQDVFSWSAQGRFWNVHQWLFQSILYLLYSVGGFLAIEIFTAIISMLFFTVVISFFLRITRNSFWTSFSLALLLYAFLYEFFIARAQVLSYLFLALSLYLIFRQLLNNKNKQPFFKNPLLLTLPITFLWVNSQASFIFLPLLLFAYGIVYIWKNPKLSRNLFLLGLLNILVSLFPPRFFLPYQLLIDFFKGSNTLASIINEWKPVTQSTYFLPYLSFLTILAGIFAYSKKRLVIFLLPLLVLMLLPFQAVRHIPYGLVSGFFTLGFLIENLSIKRKFPKALALGFIIFLSFWLIYQKRVETQIAYSNLPIKAISQLKNSNEKIYNDFRLGGFLIYFLYPKQQVFLDSRAEVYLCCEMKDLARSTENFHSFLEKYQFSKMVLERPNSTNKQMIDYLLSSKDWKISYFDKQVLIFDRIRP
ncbi:hypothetical protein HYS93_00490 [Candidatus Daviesbacteria bacterium]|nr:hypothetical protein [Candidatus Daviesbacteria bacterium]